MPPAPAEVLPMPVPIETKSEAHSSQRSRSVEIPVCLRFQRVLCSEEFRGQFLEGMPHNQSAANLLPRFPCWSMLCIGSSGIYTHAHGKSLFYTLKGLFARLVMDGIFLLNDSLSILATSQLS